MPDDEVLSSWELIARAVTRTQQRLVATVEELGVPGAWFGVLQQLLRSVEHRMPMSQLARELSMTSGGFTKLADRMGQEGLIDRRGSAGDRRVVYASLTVEGLKLAKRADRVYRAALREYVLDVLSPAAMTELVDRARPLDAASAEAFAEPPVVAAPRDPALPERRHRESTRSD